MAIYIEGMEMPKRCEDCLLCNEYETVAMIACGCLVNMRTRELGCVTRPDWCPIMEVPDHGRLIDADALMQQIEHDTPLSAVFEKTMRRYLHNAPTVIPASRKEAEDET